MIEKFLIAVVVAAMPLLYGVLGAITGEKVGQLNLGIEGIMLVGAVTSFLTAHYTESAFWAVIMAMASGVLINLIYAVLTILFRANQTVTGLVITIFGVGLANTLGKPFTGMAIPANVAAAFEPIAIPYLSDIPWIGAALFHQDLLTYLAFATVLVLYVYFNKTHMGLNITAVGDDPMVASSVAINVLRYKFVHVLISGAITALGGAFLTLVFIDGWQENVTAGQGWIAVALVIFAGWQPIRALFGALFFGGLSMMEYYFKLEISTYFVNMLPYAFTILILLLASLRKSSQSFAPKSLGLPFFRESR